MKFCRRVLILFTMLVPLSICSAQSESVYMDFRNQKISDIIYSLADVCGKSVFVDETVTGNSTFHFEDKDFESALKRFADYNQLYVNKENDFYQVSKVKLELNGKKISLNTENVLVEPLLTLLSRKTNSTVMFDNLPNATVTIRVEGVELEDILNLTLVKLPGFGLERISTGFYISKNASSSNSRRNIDAFNLSAVDNLYSVNLDKSGFVNFIEALFKKAGKEYSLLTKNNIQLESLYYKDKDFDSLLHLILEQANCDFAIADGVYYIFEIQRKDVIKKLKETRTVFLKNISAESAVNLLPQELNGSGFIKVDSARNCIYLTGSSDEIVPVERFLTAVDVKDYGKQYRRFEVKNLAVKDVVAIIPKDMAPAGMIVIPSESAFVALVDDQNAVSLSNFIKIVDDDSASHSVHLKYIKSEELLNKLPPSVSKEQFTETMDSSLVFYRGSEASYKNFLKELEQIDKPKQQIKYQILVIQRQKTKGFNWSSGLTENNTDAAAGATHSLTLSNIFNINFDIISQFGLQFAGNLNAELSDGKSHVLADTTLNGISGEEITFSNTNTYRYRDIIVDTSGDLYTSTTREISSGLTLSINGWVSGDDMITVKVNAQVSKQGSADTSSTDTTTNPPSTSEKKVSTNVRTRSGESVIIGGLFQQETDVTEKHVPVIGAIPLIGNLFKSKSTSVADTEFIIYLVPFVEREETKTAGGIERLYKKYVCQEEEK